jgi:hypothetical protein
MGGLIPYFFFNDPFRIGLTQIPSVRFAPWVFFISQLRRTSSTRFKIKKPSGFAEGLCDPVRIQT